MIDISFHNIDGNWHYIIKMGKRLIGGMAGELADAERQTTQLIGDTLDTVHYSFNPGKPVKLFEGGNMMEMFKSGKG